jgi:enoyl-CoA hydratase/carnithine racemase
VELAELKVTRYAVDARVATITLHRPDRLNAWTGRMHAEYRSLLQRAATDPRVRVIVITGSGRGFCAGADARALEGHVERGGYDSGLDDDVARPGSPPSTARPPGSASCSPATATCASPPKGPS